MGFDWQAFATGFLEQTAKNQTEAREDARNYEERQRELAERNALTISKRRAVANQVVGLTNMLRDNGASDTVIQAAVSAGPQAVAELATKVEKARSVYGRKLNSSDIETLVNVPEGFKVIDTDMEDFVKKTYGLGYQGAGVSTETVERTFMDRLTGRKMRDAARARLDSEVMMDGLTAYDINQMAAQQDYESLVPGTFITFNDVKYFNPATDMTDFSRTMSSLVSDVEDSAAFKSIETQIQQTKFSEDLDDKQKEEKLQQLYNERDALYLRSVQPTIDSMVTTYGDSFVNSVDGYLRGFLSDKYVDSLGFTAAEEEASQVAQRTVKKGDDIVAPVEPKEVVTIDLPVPGQDTKAPAKVVRTDKGLQIVDTDGSLIDPALSKKIIDKTQDFTYEQLDLSYPEKGPMPEDLTAQQYNEGLETPFQEGDPRPKTGFFASDRDKYRAKVWDMMYGETHNEDGTRKDGSTPVTPEVEQTVEQPIEEEQDIALLKNYGSSIMQHMENAGIDTSSSDQDIREELAAWYSDNAADLAVPSMAGVDDDIIISAIRQFLPEGAE